MISYNLTEKQRSTLINRYVERTAAYLLANETYLKELLRDGYETSMTENKPYRAYTDDELVCEAKAEWIGLFNETLSTFCLAKYLDYIAAK